MKVAVLGKQAELLVKPLKQHGFEIVTKDPNLVISFGGDGTSLYAEQIYPSIPRVLIRHSKVCKKCSDHDYKYIFTAIKQKKYDIVKETKVEAFLNGKKTGLIGLNEIDIHHVVPHAVRFSLKSKGYKDPELIGDGILVATSHGSTGYFNSITRKTFSKGFGIAFNNTIKPKNPLYITDAGKVTVQILRGPALLAADNNPKIFSLKTGDIITVKKAAEHANIVKIRDPRITLLRGNFVQVS